MTKTKRKDLPITKVFIIIFIATMLISTVGIGFMVFKVWLDSAKATTERSASTINLQIASQVTALLQNTANICEANQRIIAKDLFDFSDETIRRNFFTAVFDTYSDEIYCISYGNADGSYYGIRRKDGGQTELLKSSPETNGEFWVYDENGDLTNPVIRYGAFDPRERGWYQAAAKGGTPVFSPIYKLYSTEDLCISYSYPVDDPSGKLSGVLGVHTLLTYLDSFLSDIVGGYNGYAVIFEKESGELVANSLGAVNYTVLEDNTIARSVISDIKSLNLCTDVENYKQQGIDSTHCKSADSDCYINLQEITLPGINWVVLTAIPESYLITPVVHSIYLASFLIFLSLILSFLVYTLIIKQLLRPMNHLLAVSDQFANGDLTRRMTITRYDEIGSISDSFNKVADKMQFLVNNLESTVRMRTEDLQKANASLEDKRQQLRLILDSTAEAIFGIDRSGNCTFCNTSCIKQLGYTAQSDLLGKNMNRILCDDCSEKETGIDCSYNVIKVLENGEGTHVDGVTFRRFDGTPLDVEYYSYPQVKDGTIIGAVVTFIDISERKHREEQIRYLNCHDTLTGLHNRACFNENRSKIDILPNLPLSVIFADINGLKMTNDIFGHTAGDNLIRKSADILRRSCRATDMIARVGGDEFIIMLPKTEKAAADEVIAKIRAGFADARIEAIKCSISLGCDTKDTREQLLDVIIANAENAMYKDKTLNRKAINRGMINTLIETLHARSALEKQHSENVSKLCGEVSRAMKLPENEVGKAIRAGYLHDIGKIVLSDDILKKEYLSEEEFEKMRQHSVIGYRILNLFDDTLDLAEIVYGHHEKWDGTGYPRGLAGEQIPLISRIISVVETYDRIMNRAGFTPQDNLREALEVIELGEGSQFDPAIAEVFVKMMTPPETHE